MHVVGHKRVRVQRTFCVLQGFAQPMKVGEVVVVGEEARLAVMAALHDVERGPVYVGTSPPRHDPQRIRPERRAPSAFSRRSATGN